MKLMNLQGNSYTYKDEIVRILIAVDQGKHMFPPTSITCRTSIYLANAAVQLAIINHIR